MSDTGPSTLPRHSSSTGVNPEATLERNSDGTAILRDLAVFKAGTFTDMDGETDTWTVEDLESMAGNFRALRTEFPNVPWRTNHGADVNDVVGYWTDAKAKGDVLYADVLLTEPDAVDKWERGTFRERSIEIGEFTDSKGEKHWPAIHGTAFVDRGAVPGLFRAPTEDKTRYYQETLDMSDTTEEGQGASEEESSAQESSAEKEVEKSGAEGAKEKVEEKATEKDPGDESADSKFAAPSVDIKAFKAMEQQVAEMGVKLQAANAYVAEQDRIARHALADELVADNKIMATAKDKVVKLIDTLSGDQYAMFRAVMDDAPTLSLFQQHLTVDTSTEIDRDTSTEAQRKIDEETVAMFQRSGSSQEQIEKTSAYRRLHAKKGDS